MLATLELEMTVTDALRSKLESHDATLYRVAKDTGISWATLRRFLDGRGLRSEQIDKLSAYFGLSLTDDKPAPKKRPRG